MTIVWILLGFGLGLLLAALAAREILRRQLRAVRQAERRARASERLAEIGSMTGGLAHEIKNPLSTIGLNAQLLGEGIEDSELDPDTKRRLTTRVQALRRETERLRGILQDFLEFAGQMRLEARATDVGAIVTELVDFYLPEAERHGVRLRADIAPAPSGAALIAHADAKLLKQALLNLMINATQAMALPAVSASAAIDANGDRRAGPRGDLILRAQPYIDAVHPPATLTARKPDHSGTPMIAIHVIDTGPGIAPDVLAKVFQPYFTTKAGGSGLGLPTARRIIDEHGGRLEVHSEVGKGTDFTVLLPVVKRTPEPRPAPAVETSEPARPSRFGAVGERND